MNAFNGSMAHLFHFNVYFGVDIRIKTKLNNNTIIIMNSKL
jgi:hypothetical protein